MPLHEKLDQLREDRGLSVRELARKLRVKSDTTVGRWMSGEAQPRFDEAVKLAGFFGVSLDWLAGLAESHPDLTEDERFVLRSFRTIKIDADEAVRRMNGYVNVEEDAIEARDETEPEPKRYRKTS